MQRSRSVLSRPGQTSEGRIDGPGILPVPVRALRADSAAVAQAAAEGEPRPEESRLYALAAGSPSDAPPRGEAV